MGIIGGIKSPRSFARANKLYFLLSHLIKEFFARLLEHIDNEIEALTTFVVWVGDIVVGASVGSEVVTHTIYLVDILSGRSKADHSLVVAVVHNDDAVKVVEVRRTEWARTVRQAVATTMRSLTHTGIGQLASVTRVCAGGIYLKLFAKPTSENLLAENLLRHWRTTYIAEADK